MLAAIKMQHMNTSRHSISQTVTLQYLPALQNKTDCTYVSLYF